MKPNTLVKFRSLLHDPVKVGIACLLVLTLSIILNGTLWRVWGLYRDHDELSNDIKNIIVENKQLEEKMQLVKDPSYIERQARERMDLVSENDLIFVFAD